jgi:SAM-dependent methyltransferase
MWPLHPQWLLAISGEGSDLDAALTPLQGRVLDIGCADRHLARRLSGKAQYIGLDYPSTALGMYGTRPDVFGDARALPFADAGLDAVILKDVLEHLEGPEAALAEIARVLRAGGRLVLWMPFIYPIHDAPHDFQRFTAHAMSAYLGAKGFRVLELKPVLKPVETAALMCCLSLADAAEQILIRRRWLLPVVPVLALLVLLSNLFGKGLSWLPSSQFMPAFYRVAAERERRDEG